MPKKKVKMEYALSRDALLRNEIDLVHIATCGSGPQSLLTCICHHDKVKSVDDYPILAKHKRSLVNGKSSHFAHIGQRKDELEDEKLYYQNLEKINETIIHQEAKKIISNLSEIQLYKMGDPYILYNFKFQNDLDNNEFKIEKPDIKRENIYFLKVLESTIEKEIDTSLGVFKPDVLLTVDDYNNTFHCNKDKFLLGVEIFVTSGVNDSKKEKIKLANLNSIEIRLNSLYKKYKDNQMIFDCNDIAQMHSLRQEILRELSIKNLNYLFFYPDPNDNSHIYNSFNEIYMKKLNQHNSVILSERTTVFDYVIHEGKPLFSSDATLKAIYSCPCCNADVKTNNNIFFEHIDPNNNCFNKFTKEIFVKNALNKLIKKIDWTPLLNMLDFDVEFLNVEIKVFSKDIILKVNKNNTISSLYTNLEEIKNYLFYPIENITKDSIKKIFKRFNYFNNIITESVIKNPIFIGKNNDRLLFLNEKTLENKLFHCYHCNDLLNIDLNNNKVTHSKINECLYFTNYEKYKEGMITSMLKQKYSHLVVDGFTLILKEFNLNDIEYSLSFYSPLLEKDYIIKFFKNIKINEYDIEQPIKLNNFITNFENEIKEEENKKLITHFKHVEKNANCPFCGTKLKNYAHENKTISCPLFELNLEQLENIKSLKLSLLQWTNHYKQFVGQTYCINSNITKKTNFLFILKKVNQYDEAICLDIISNEKEYKIWLWIYKNPHIKNPDINFLINNFYPDLNLCFEKNQLIKFL